MSIVNYYSLLGSPDGKIYALSTPSDGIVFNFLIGGRNNDTFYGESGVGLTNEMDGLRGDDIFYGGSGAGTYNDYIGGQGIDKAIIAAEFENVIIEIDYTGGMFITRADNGYDSLNNEVEIIQFASGESYFGIYAGAFDDCASKLTFKVESGDKLIISNDFIDALTSGNVALVIQDVDLDGTMDTLLNGSSGINSYTLSGYDLTQHPTAKVIGVYGDGVIFDLT